MSNIIQSTQSIVSIADILDIILVTFVVYGLIQYIQGTRAWQVAKGVAIFIGATLIAQWLHLYTLHWILSGILTIGAISVVIIFQPELRTLLASLGRTRFSTFAKHLTSEQTNKIISEVCDAVEQMSRKKTGALIVFEREDGLNDLMTSRGTVVNADITSELIRNIFYVGSPLHDGATIIRNDKIHAAGCVLPLSDGKNIAKSLGTRHRAAVGITECSDCFVVVVSEETGLISICEKGQIFRFSEIQELKKALRKIYQKESKIKIRKFKKGGK